MKLLAQHHALSDDVRYRFSNRKWEGWPVLADKYVRWLADSPGDLIVLAWDFETFGEYHAADTGIFDFLDALPREGKLAGLSFLTPCEAVDRYGDASYDLPLPAFATTWAGSGGLEFFLGNDAQRAIFRLMMQAYNKACLTGNDELIDLALVLAEADNLHLIQPSDRPRSELEVPTYLMPREWETMGPERVVVELQRVFENFIEALDPYITQIRMPSEARV
jgi:alpha-amylase